MARRLTMLAWNRTQALLGVASVVLTGFGGVAACRAGDAPGTNKKDVAKSQPSPAEIGQWIKDLDSDSFATRQTAAAMLYQTGKPAIAPVADAGLGKSLEVTMQSVNVLRRLMQSPEKETQEAATDALERLSKTETSAAAPAKEALAPPPPVANRAGNLQPFGIGNIQGNIRIFGGGKIQAGGMQVFRIQANGINQNRSVDVDENGKRTHITEDQNGIEVKVTEKLEGKDKTDAFKAKDADELKKKFPEAHKLYEKYVNGPGVGNIQIQAQAIPIQIGVAPGFPPPAQNAVQPNTVQKQASQQIAEAQKRIAEATENLRKNAGAAPNADELRRAFDQLDEARKELESARERLGGG